MYTLKSTIGWSAILLALAFLAICSPSFAEVQHGDVITPANAVHREFFTTNALVRAAQ